MRENTCLHCSYPIRLDSTGTWIHFTSDKASMPKGYYGLAEYGWVDCLPKIDGTTNAAEPRDRKKITTTDVLDI